jgi:hypothetical protein
LNLIKGMNDWEEQYDQALGQAGGVGLMQKLLIFSLVIIRQQG